MFKYIVLISQGLVLIIRETFSVFRYRWYTEIRKTQLVKKLPLTKSLMKLHAFAYTTSRLVYLLGLTVEPLGYN